MVKIRVKCRIILRFFGNKLAVPEYSALDHINVAIRTLGNVEISCDYNGAIKFCGELIYKPYAVLSRFLAPVVKMSVHGNKCLAALVFGELRPRSDSCASAIPRFRRDVRCFAYPKPALVNKSEFIFFVKHR